MNLKTKIQAECLDKIGMAHRGAALLGTGAGKTLLGIKHMAKQYTDYAMFLIVAPKVSIFNEWKKQCVEHGYEYLLDHMSFVTYLSLHKQDTKLYDCVYLDECHNLKDSHREFLNNYDGKILGLTGTYPVYKASERYIMCNEFCPPLYSYTVEEAIDDKLLNDYTIILHPLHLSNDYNIPTSTGKFMSEQAVYNMWTNIINNSQGKAKNMNAIIRMRKVQSFATKTNYIKKMLNGIGENKVLVFTESKDQCALISEHYYYSGNKANDKNIDMFSKGEIKILASIKQLAEGINIPNLKIGIIQHSYSNERLLGQKIGRFLRLNPSEHAIIHILYYKDTIDETWLKASLKHLNHSNIKIHGKTTSSHQ